MSRRLLTKSPQMAFFTSCKANGCSTPLVTKATLMTTSSATSTDEVNSTPFRVARPRENMNRRTHSRPVKYNVWTMSEQAGPVRPCTSHLLHTYNSGEEAVIDAQKWLDQEDGKQEDGVQLLRFEDDEYRRLLGKYCRKMYTVVMENGLWKGSNVVWTQAVPQ